MPRLCHSGQRPAPKVNTQQHCASAGTELSSSRGTAGSSTGLPCLPEHPVATPFSAQPSPLPRGAYVLCWLTLPAMEMLANYASVAGHVQTPLAYGTKDLCGTTRASSSAGSPWPTPATWGPPTTGLLGEPRPAPPAVQRSGSARPHQPFGQGRGPHSCCGGQGPQRRPGSLSGLGLWKTGLPNQFRFV